MDKPLLLYRLSWNAIPRNTEIYSARHPPTPGILKYWYMGFGTYPSGVSYDTYFGIVAAPYGVDPTTVLQQEFYDAVVISTHMYNPHDNWNNLPMSAADWDMQRLAYVLGTGTLYERPVVGHYDIAPDSTWWCTTNIEIFDL